MSVDATRHRELHMDHYARLVGPIWGLCDNPSGFQPTADRVYLEPIQINRRYTVDTISWLRGALNAGVHLVRLGIYEDNGDQPDGGALLDSTGNLGIQNPNNTIKETAIGPITLAPGLYWLAQVYDTSSAGELRQYLASMVQSSGGALESRYYDAGSFTLTDPCPATTTHVDSLYSYLLVSAIP